jgi:glycosyltransferase involved in cell wall biosynthesis
VTHRIKVVHVTEDMPVGGQERIIAVLASGLDRDRFEAELWCLVRGGALADAVRQSGITVRVLNLPSYHNPLGVLRLALLLRRFAADIVHTHGDFAGTFGRLAAVLAGKRALVAHVHTLQPGFRRRHLWIQRVLAHFTRRIICVSQAVRDFVIAGIGIPVGKICVVHNGVARRADAAGRPDRQTGLAPGDCLAVSVGSLVENKGHRVLVDAFHRAVSTCPALRLLIVGDGPLRAELESRVAGLNLSPKVGFTGCLADVHPVLDQAEMFILPTIQREGLPLALLEANQHGLAVVASRVGGVPEVVEHGCSGLLVPPGDPIALSDAILTLAADRRLRQALGAAGRAQYEARFRAERMVAQVESVYASICEVRKVAA